MKIDELINVSLEVILSDEMLQGYVIKNYREHVNPDICSGCGGKKIEEYFLTLKSMFMKGVIESDFKFKDNGVVLPLEFGSSILLSNANITNELAIEYLKINPNRIHLFEKYPENWKELIGDKEVKVERKPIKKNTAPRNRSAIK